MVLVNDLVKAEKLPLDILTGLAKLLAPICPHFAQECFALLGNEGLIDFEPWPTVDESKLASKPVTYAIQVNGKLRATIDFKKDASDEELEELKKMAVSDERVTPFLEGKQIVKIIAVKNKIISIVVKG